MKMRKYLLLILIVIILTPINGKAYKLTINEMEHGQLSIQGCDSHCYPLDSYDNISYRLLTIYTTPDSGYAVDKITLKYNDGEIIHGYENNYIDHFPMSNKDATLTVTFKKQETIDRIKTKSENITSNNGVCNVLKGNGKNLGDEIACGTEHFYVLKSNNDTLTLFAKHNLNVGSNIYKEKIKKSEDDSSSDYKYCSHLADQKNARNRNTGFYEQEGYCFYEVMNDNPDKIMQSMNHQSAHWDKDGNYLYPQAGDIYLNLNTNSIVDSSISYSDPSYYDFEIDLNNTDILGPILSNYKNTLNEYNVDVKDIDLLSLSEIEEIISKESNKKLPLQEWGDAVKEIPTSPGPGGGWVYNPYGEFGSITEYIPQKYNWVYGTTYWLSTAFRGENTYYGNYYMFIASLGKLCGSGFTYCASSTYVGTGVRPVVTISSKQLKYLIKTKTDGNGTIEVINDASGGEKIKFKTNSKKGYILKKLIITTDSGKTITFSKGNIINNNDGTITIDKNIFTMPFENITIEAKWEKEKILKNPETRNIILTTLLTIIASIIIGTYLYKKNESIT